MCHVSAFIDIPHMKLYFPANFIKVKEIKLIAKTKTKQRVWIYSGLNFPTGSGPGRAGFGSGRFETGPNSKFKFEF